jgi:hypothetical protein
VWTSDPVAALVSAVPRILFILPHAFNLTHKYEVTVPGRLALQDTEASTGGDEVHRDRQAGVVLNCLRKYGQRLDLEIAQETGLALKIVREHLASLAATGAVILCSLTRFEKGARIDAWQCRVSGYVPPRAPGRKPTTQPTSPP